MNAVIMDSLNENSIFRNTLQGLRESLIMAARRGEADAIEACLQAGMSPNMIDEFGCTPLMIIASQGLEDCLQMMLDTPGCIVNKRTSSREVALHYASERGHRGCVKKLLDRSAMVNVANDWGETPLIKAVHSGDPETVRLLLERGAKMDMTDLHGFDAMIHAVRQGNVNILKMFLQYRLKDANLLTRPLPLHHAALFGQLECATLLLDAGTKPNIRDANGFLPIELATTTDHAEVIKCLIDTGASKEEINLAVAAASKANACRSMKVLLEHGGNPDVTDRRGIPALFLAIDANNVTMVHVLIQHNCDVNRNLRRVYIANTELGDLNDRLGTMQCDFVSPVMVAALRGLHLILEMLYSAGASITKFMNTINSPRCRRFMPSYTSKSNQIYQWMLKTSSTPVSLSHACRLIIRSRLAKSEHVHKLPLPPRIIEYLSFSDLEDFKI